jgi:hypothetical protein
MTTSLLSSNTKAIATTSGVTIGAAMVGPGGHQLMGGGWSGNSFKVSGGTETKSCRGIQNFKLRYCLIPRDLTKVSSRSAGTKMTLYLFTFTHPIMGLMRGKNHAIYYIPTIFVEVVNS